MRRKEGALEAMTYDPVPEEEAFAAYAAAAQAWDVETIAHLRAARRQAWMVAGLGGACALLSLIALVLLLPLKEFAPYVVRVSDATGTVDIVRPLIPGALKEDEAVTQAMLVQYLTARETYDPSDIRARFAQVRLMSAESAWEDYRALWTPDAPTNPAIRYGWTTTITTRVEAISFLNETTAAVRYRLTTQDRRSGAIAQQPYVAIIAFRYVGKPMTNAARWANPLGFQVVRFRSDPETLAPAPAAAQAAPTTLRMAKGDAP